MKWIFLLLTAGALVIPDFAKETVLGELWYKEEIYFNPAKKSDLTWTGMMYYAPAKKCFDLQQPEMTQKVKYRNVHCDAAFEARATEPYVKIADFEVFKAKFLECLDKADTKCLRGFISKTLTISFGPESYEDRRDNIFRTWKKSDFDSMAANLRRGVETDGNYKRFPPKAGSGMRGAFVSLDGGWRLESYLGGD